MVGWKKKIGNITAVELLMVGWKKKIGNITAVELLMVGWKKKIGNITAVELLMVGWKKKIGNITAVELLMVGWKKKIGNITAVELLMVGWKKKIGNITAVELLMVGWKKKIGNIKFTVMTIKSWEKKLKFAIWYKGNHLNRHISLFLCFQSKLDTFIIQVNRWLADLCYCAVFSLIAIDMKLNWKCIHYARRYMSTEWYLSKGQCILQLCVCIKQVWMGWKLIFKYKVQLQQIHRTVEWFSTNQTLGDILYPDWSKIVPSY